MGLKQKNHKVRGTEDRISNARGKVVEGKVKGARFCTRSKLYTSL